MWRWAIVIFFSLIGLGLLVMGGYWLEVRQSGGESAAGPSGRKNGEVAGWDEFDYNGVRYRYVWREIAEPAKLRLYPNFEAKAQTAGLAERRQCSLLVNGGFYDEAGQPLGWWYSEGEELGKVSQSQLLDGFVTMTYDGEVEIGRRRPNDLTKRRWGLQTGPLFISDCQPRKLTIKNDGAARRVVMGVTESQKVIFGVMVGEKSLTSGPKLADLPEIVMLLAEASNATISAAVNLDGGSASTFLDEGLTISELAPIGSYFCYRPNN